MVLSDEMLSVLLPSQRIEFTFVQALAWKLKHQLCKHKTPLWLHATRAGTESVMLDLTEQPPSQNVLCPMFTSSTLEGRALTCV
jgi:hypothetical protein